MINTNDKQKPIIKSVVFRLFTVLIFLFTVMIYILVFSLLYLHYTGGLELIYTEYTTNLLLIVVIILFILGWVLSYGIYVGLINPSYQVFNIIAEIVDGMVQKGDVDKAQILYLRDFIQGSLLQLEKSSFTHKVDVSADAEIYIKKLEALTKQNNDLAQSKEELSQLVEKLEKQQKLLELEQAKTSAIIDAIPNGLLASSRDGNIFLVNQESERILGLSSDSLLGRFIYKVLPPLDDDCDLPTDKKINQGNFKKFRNIRIFNYKSPDNRQKITIENTASPIIINDDVVGVVDVLRDKTQEQATERAQKEFVSIASHQLRTPITSIKWNAEMILSNDNLTQEIRDSINDIYTANIRMEKLVNSLLNVSRIDLGKIKFLPQEINLAQYIDNVLKLLAVDIERKQINIQKDIQITGTIKNDPVYIDIIISNILSNAVKYTPKQGNIKISIAQNSENNKVLIEVIDTGIGIPTSQQSQIFSRLFRADNAKNSDTDGNGLGLYVVKKLIESMHGNVWFESAENKGATFFIELPVVIDESIVV